MDVSQAWDFLSNHPMYSDAPKIVDISQIAKQMGLKKPTKTKVRFQNNHFPYQGTLDIAIVKVNPKKHRIENDHKLNTQIEIWLESGPWLRLEDMDENERKLFSEEGCPTHDYRLDCGGPTFEKALVKLATLVRKYYGVKGRKLQKNSAKKKKSK